MDKIIETTEEPFFHTTGMIALVYHEWGTHWMTPHHMLTCMSKYFHVVWVNPPHGRREVVSRMISPPKDDVVSVPIGFEVYFPEYWLPKIYKPKWLGRLTFDERIKRARHLLEEKGCKKIILSIWHPQFERALSSIPFDLSCYHIDDEYAFYDGESPSDNAEARILAAVDQVFITSAGLYERKGKVNPHTAIATEGVNYKKYATTVAEPSDIAPIPHPRIGYTGVLKKQLDWLTLLQLATKHPEWSFVFVGPQAPHAEVADAIRELSCRQNVYFLGAKSVDDLASYPQHFDVCIMPYRKDEYTNNVYPLKLHEYLASGRPIVGTDILTLQSFDHVIAVVGTCDEWSAELASALTPAANTDGCRMARQAVARRYDWGAIIAKMSQTIAERLGAEYVDQLKTFPAHVENLTIGN